jgi:hypothetical protein
MMTSYFKLDDFSSKCGDGLPGDQNSMASQFQPEQALALGQLQGGQPVHPQLACQYGPNAQCADPNGSPVNASDKNIFIMVSSRLSVESTS